MFGSPSPVAVTRTRSVSESESSFSLPSAFSAPTFLKSFYQGSLGSLADSGSLKRWEGVLRQTPFLDPNAAARDLTNGICGRDWLIFAGMAVAIYALAVQTF